MLIRDEGREIVSRGVSRNASIPIAVTLASRVATLRLVHPLNAAGQITVSTASLPSGVLPLILTAARFSQEAKAEIPRIALPSIISDLRLLQPAKADSPIYAMVSGTVNSSVSLFIFDNAAQPLKAFAPIDNTESGKVSSSSFSQPPNAPSGIAATPSSMVTVSRPVQP